MKVDLLNALFEHWSHNTYSINIGSEFKLNDDKVVRVEHVDCAKDTFAHRHITNAKTFIFDASIGASDNNSGGEMFQVPKTFVIQYKINDDEYMFELYRDYFDENHIATFCIDVVDYKRIKKELPKQEKNRYNAKFFNGLFKMFSKSVIYVRLPTGHQLSFNIDTVTNVEYLTDDHYMLKVNHWSGDNEGFDEIIIYAVVMTFDQKRATVMIYTYPGDDNMICEAIHFDIRGKRYRRFLELYLSCS